MILDTTWDIILGIIAFAVCFYLLFKHKRNLLLEVNEKVLGLAFLSRVGAGVLLTLVYTYYYPDRNLADTFRYFDDSYYIHELLKEDPWEYFLVMTGFHAEMRESIPLLEETTNWFPALRSPLYNDNRTVIRINAILRWFSFGSYYVHMCLFAFMGFIGQMYIYKAFQKYFKGKQLLFSLVLFFVPSLVFWSSGILKEGTLLLALGYLLYRLEFIKREGWSKADVVRVILLFLFLFQMKFYVGLMLWPIFSWHFLIKKWPAVKRWKLLFINYGAYFLAAIIWHFIRFKWSLFTVFKWKKKDFEGLAASMDAKSLIKTYDLEDNALSFLINIPQGLFNILTRPFLWETYSWATFLSAIENVLIIVFIVLCFYFRKKDRMPNMGGYFLVYSLTLLTVIGMVTPIVGSLVRYKVPALPFLLMYFVMMVDVEALKKKFSWIK